MHQKNLIRVILSSLLLPVCATSAPPAKSQPPEIRKAIRVTPRCEFRTWRQGEPALRLIRKEEGFCALTGITCYFRDSAQSIRLFIARDGYWYLTGNSNELDATAECVIVHY